MAEDTDDITTAKEESTESGEDEKPRKKKLEWSRVWQEARDLLWEKRGRLSVGLVLLIFSRLAGMVLPASTKYLIDEVIGKGRADLLLWIGVAAGVATLIQAATSFSLTLLLGVAGQRSINELRMRVQSHMIHLPVSFFENAKSGELVSRVMNDADGIRNLIGTGFVQLIGGLISSGIALGVLFWLNWRLTMVTLIMMLLFGAVMATGFSRLRPLFRERGKLTADVNGRLTESFGGVRVVKAYTAEAREEQNFAESAGLLVDNIVKSMTGVTTITSLSSLIFGLIGISMSIFGAREVLAGRMTVGDIFMFVVFTGLMVTPLIQMSSIGTQITEAFAGLDRIREILEQPKESEIGAARSEIDNFRGDIAFERVHFEYEPDKPVLRDVSFKAPAGTTTALVGPSGSGKSTITSLVMAFRTPQEGTISIDGRDLATVSLSDYRSKLAVVLQDDFLFDGTIEENIAYSRPESTREKIEEAGRIARCDEFVDRFPDGYDTVIGERGVKLSGGQRQRVTIARALLADPRILILDEATSNLDSESEFFIQEGLKALRTGRTTFVIAHRLSTIRNADQILVVQDGEIFERGTHAELMKLNGRYRELHDQQFRIAQNQFINPGEEFSAGDVKEREDSAEKAPTGRSSSLLNPG